MDKNNAMRDAMHCHVLEIHETFPSIDNSTAALHALQQCLAGILRASLLVSNNLKTPEDVNVIGMINALTQILDFVCDITERIDNGTQQS